MVAIGVSEVLLSDGEEILRRILPAGMVCEAASKNLRFAARIVHFEPLWEISDAMRILAH